MTFCLGNLLGNSVAGFPCLCARIHIEKGLSKAVCSPHLGIFADVANDGSTRHLCHLRSRGGSRANHSSNLEITSQCCTRLAACLCFVLDCHLCCVLEQGRLRSSVKSSCYDELDVWGRNQSGTIDNGSDFWPHFNRGHHTSTCCSRKAFRDCGLPSQINAFFQVAILNPHT